MGLGKTAQVIYLTEYPPIFDIVQHMAMRPFLPLPPDNIVLGCSAHSVWPPHPPPGHLPSVPDPELGAGIQALVPGRQGPDVPRQGAGRGAAGDATVEEEGVGGEKGRTH